MYFLHDINISYPHYTCFKNALSSLVFRMMYNTTIHLHSFLAISSSGLYLHIPTFSFIIVFPSCKLMKFLKFFIFDACNSKSINLL